MGWDVVAVGEVTQSKLGKMLSKKAKQGMNPVPYLGNAQVRWRSFEEGDLPTMDFSPSELEKLSLERGDLLVCEGGEVGRCAIWQGKPRRLSYQKALHRVRCDSSRLVPEYLQEYFFHMAALGGLTRSTSTATIAHLTGVRLRQLHLPLPPIEKQLKFSGFYRTYRNTLQRQKCTEVTFSLLSKSLTQQAFRGEL